MGDSTPRTLVDGMCSAREAEVDPGMGKRLGVVAGYGSGRR